LVTLVTAKVCVGRRVDSIWYTRFCYFRKQLFKYLILFSCIKLMIALWLKWWCVYEKKVLAGMANNSSNINKTNNHHLWPKLIQHKHKDVATCGVGNPVPGLGQEQNVAGLKRRMGYLLIVVLWDPIPHLLIVGLWDPIPPLDSWSATAMYILCINKRWKNCLCICDIYNLLNRVKLNIAICFITLQKHSTNEYQFY
jgi:hypothetical protein